MKKLRRITDVLMTLVLLFLMGYQLWSEAAHEWAGVAMVLLFLLHQVLNCGWYRSLVRGRWTPFSAWTSFALRVMQVVVNVLCLVAMMSLAVSGMMMSTHVFAGLNLPGSLSVARRLHLVASHWGFVLMALHLGLHWCMVIDAVRRRQHPAGRKRAPMILAPLLATAAAFYGLCAFIWRGFPDVMLLRTEFVFLDFSEPAPLFYIDILAIMGFFIFLGHCGSQLLRRTYTAKVKSTRTQLDRKTTYSNNSVQKREP